MGPQYDLLVEHPHEETTGPPNRVFRVNTRAIPRYEIIPPHYHSDLEIVVFSDIQGETLVEGSAHRIEKDSIHTIATNAVHSFTLHGISLQSRVWVVQINLEYFRECIGRFDPHAANTVCQLIVQRPVASSHNANKVRKLVLKLAQLEKEGGSHEMEIAGALGVLYSLLQNLPGNWSSEQTVTYHPRIRSLMDTVASFADRPASLDQIAYSCALSKFHLCRTFKRQTGMTVNEYLTSMRIMRAQNLMITGDRSVTQACFECGFESVSYFIAVFSRIVGTTPKQWAMKAIL